MNADTIGHPEKAARVRAMFDQIAPRYDLLNHILSLNIDKLWRAKTVRALADVLARPDASALDLCCGTGDLSIAIAERTPARVVGLDFSRPMLDFAHSKARESRIAFVQGDASGVPFPDGSFDAVTIAFGLRNLSSVERGLAEIYRLLAPGGRAAILEFSRPVVPVLRELFGFYFSHVLPRIGGVVSGSYGAYTYLPESVKTFPDQRSLKVMMESVGFGNVRFGNLSGGIAALHVGERLA
jgi:demethylmenaquinone methyltransferase/2-methoxy-6-polyprenyl-1,4-benzoquinol methylase